MNKYDFKQFNVLVSVIVVEVNDDNAVCYALV